MKFKVGDGVVILKDGIHKWKFGSVIYNDSQDKDYKIQLIQGEVYVDEHELKYCINNFIH